MIHVQNLSKTFKVYRKDPGFMGSVKSLFKRSYYDKVALKNINLQVHPGEILGLLGANGAGKTTLVKILSGIVYPTGGTVDILGFTPWERDNRYRQKLSLIMGQKAQLWWDLPAYDSFLLLKEIYRIPQERFKKNIDYLGNSLQVQSQLNVPVRKLSLGERMKVELMAALLHDPEVIFLDEPTIGLDLTSQKAVRNFLLQYQKERSPIIILTSHYMQDIQELCPRIALIKSGEIVFDGPLQKVLDNYASSKAIELDFDERDLINFQKRVLTKHKDYELIGNKVKVRVPRKEIPSFMKETLESFNPSNFSIQDVDINIVIEKLMSDHDHKA